MRLTCCRFKSDAGEQVIMFLRANLTPSDALYYCTKLGLPMNGPGEFSCWPVPEDLVDLFAEHAERTLTRAKAQELFGDKWLPSGLRQ